MNIWKTVSFKTSIGLALMTALMLLAAPAQATPPNSCQCTGGIDRNGASIPPSSTYCGYKTCGLGNVQFECTGGNNWKQLGSCGSTSSVCSSGQNAWGYAIPPAGTYSGFQTCGSNMVSRYNCSSNNWSTTSPACTFCEGTGATSICRCYDGKYQNGTDIPPTSTYCGFAVVGVSGEKWQCTAGGWEKYANSGQAVNNAKFGINTAAYLDTGAEPAGWQKAQTYRMGYYLMMIGDQAEENQISWRIAAPIETARASYGLKSILRLCDGSGNCNYKSHADRLVTILNSTYLRDYVQGPWFVVVGPNEPPTEKWMTPTTQAMTPDPNGYYTSAQLDTIAAEMANFADYVMDNTVAAHRQPNGGDIGMLSPVWDCHNPNTQSLMAKFQQQLVARGRSMTQFDGIGINAYNLHGNKATTYINQCKSYLQSATGVSSSNFNYYLTETGMLEVTQNGKPPALARDNFRELNKTLRSDSTIKAVLFFNATGRNGDPNFQYNVLNQSCEWQYVLGGHAQN